MIAALEQFLRDAASAAAGESPSSAWKRAALAEGVARQPGVPERWRQRALGRYLSGS